MWVRRGFSCWWLSPPPLMGFRNACQSGPWHKWRWNDPFIFSSYSYSFAFFCPRPAVCWRRGGAVSPVFERGGTRLWKCKPCWSWCVSSAAAAVWESLSHALKLKKRRSFLIQITRSSFSGKFRLSDTAMGTHRLINIVKWVYISCHETNTCVLCADTLENDRLLLLPDFFFFYYFSFEQL